LAAPEAEKTGEWRQGIGRVLESPPDLPGLDLLLKAVAAVNGGVSLNARGDSPARLGHYPGSPRVARVLMRKTDRLWCAELHPDDARALAREFRGDAQAEIRRMDGYEAIRAWLPPLPRANPRGESTMAAGIRPPPKRGVILIDPPFEQRDEFRHLLKGLKDGHRRFATGIFVLWYPIKNRAPVDAFHAALAESAIRRILAAELLIHALDDPERLNGCGLIVVNPPWQFETDLARLAAGLARLFAPDEGASSVRWLAGE
jgi:23S rRNA (adenine2030-N6)-methyltransferase